MKTPKLLKKALTFATTAALAYLAGSFIAAEFNIAEWGQGLRAFVGFFALIFGFLSIARFPDLGEQE